MDPGLRTPLIDLFRRGEAPRDVRLLAAQGVLAPRPHEQLALLVLLANDEDPEVAAEANGTLARLPLASLRALLALGDMPPEIRAFFADRGIEPDAAGAGNPSEPLVEREGDLPDLPVSANHAPEQPKTLSSLPITDRIKLAMKGTREQRAQLIRDSSKLVATAVLSSPKVSEAEIETFARMANVSDEVLRVIGTNRTWLKNYGVVVGLTRNPKTPPAISLQLMHRLTGRDIRMLSTDRNVPEVVRFAARRIVVKSSR